MKKQHDKHQYEYAEEENAKTMEQIKNVYTDGAMGQDEENEEKLED
ncbi:hypothetical protein [Bacillus niameyensis]|nr:hypothetical protein [Bacillus niameyensis]